MMTLMQNGSTQKRGAWRNAPWLPAVILISVQVMNGMRDMPQLSFFVIYLQEQLQLPPVSISSVVAGAQIAGMVMALLGGGIAARLGSKWVLLAGLTLSAIGSLSYQVQSLPLVTLLWFIGGAGMALLTVGGASYLTRISAQGSLGILAAVYALSVTIGGALGNPLAGVLIERYGFAALTWAAIAISALSFVVVAALLENPHQEGPAGPASLSAFWSGVWSVTRLPNVRFVIGLRCLATIFYGMLTVHIPLLLNSLTGSKVTVAAYVTTNLIVASAAQLLTGRAADRWGARGPSLAAYAAMILSGVGLALSTTSVWGLYLFGVTGIAAAWALATLLYVWVNDGIAKASHPATFGLQHAVWSLSMITGSVLGSLFASSLAGLPFLLAGLFNVGSLFLVVAYYRRVQSSPAA